MSYISPIMEFPGKTVQGMILLSVLYRLIPALCLYEFDTTEPSLVSTAENIMHIDFLYGEVVSVSLYRGNQLCRGLLCLSASAHGGHTHLGG